MEIRLKDAQDFFDNLVEPAFNNFKVGEPDFLKIYSLASALFHISEWVIEHNKIDVQNKFGTAINTYGELWRVVEKQITDAGFIRDLNNAGKHVKITFKPSTDMLHAANTVIETTGYGNGPYGTGPYGGVKQSK